MLEAGQYRCFGCCRISPECNYAYCARLYIQDSTGSACVSAFDEAATAILGVTAREAFVLDETNPEQLVQAIQQTVFAEYVFRLQASRIATENGCHVNFIVKEVAPVNPRQVARVLLNDIQNVLLK